MLFKIDWKIKESPIKVYDPCAGRGGILDALLGQMNCEVFYNEIDLEKYGELHKKFPKFRGCRSNISGSSLEAGGSYDVVIMNPPFYSAPQFLLHAMRHLLNPGTGQICTLFPKYSLAKIYSTPQLFIKMFSFSKVEIEDIDFDCNYGAKVCMIYLKW